MNPSRNQDVPVRQSRLRRTMLTVLALVYLFVGIAHNASCADDPIASGFAIAQVAVASDDSVAKPGIVICDLCPTCVPAVMPAPVVAAAPSALRCRHGASVATLLIAVHPRLETPPPRHLT